MRSQSFRRGALVFLLATLLSAVPRPAFDLASIHEVASSKGKFKIRGADLAMTGNRFYLTASLRGMIQAAYGLTEQEVAGPAWLDANAFQIVAQAPPESSDADLRLMCQSLLAERFGLTFHRAKQLQPVFALLPAKGGPRLRNGARVPLQIKTKPGRIVSQSASMAWLADTLSRPLGRRVLDQTGITGDYQILLNFSPAGTDAPTAYDKPKPKGKALVETDSPPPLFTAIQEQLGLRLEAQKAMVDQFVVDHIEKTPTPN